MTTRLPPGPRSLPVIGNGLALLRDPLSFLSKLARTYGDIASFQVGRQRAVLLNEPTLIARIVRDRSFVRGAHSRRGMLSLLGPGLLCLEGSPHLRHRRLMQPAFHRSRIEHYVEIMADETYHMLARWSDGETRDLRAEMMRLTFTIVARSLLSTDTAKDAPKVDRALQRVLPAVLRSTMLSHVSSTPLPALYGPGTRAAIAALHELVQSIVARRREDGIDRNDLLSMLLATRDEDGSALSDEEICAETLTILLAGHDTTANTLSWAWYLLSANPALQDELATEVRGVVGDRPVSYHDLPQLTLADRVVRESLRMYPAAWWADRVSDEQTELAGFTIPAQTMVVFSTYVTQRDARYFPEPERFDPDRFLPERAAQIREGAYLPFGAGVHLCIGNAFALMEARLIVAAMAQRFAVRATAPHTVRPYPLVTLGMSGPLHVALRSRPHASACDSAPAHTG